jgi:hypothetical protein
MTHKSPPSNFAIINPCVKANQKPTQIFALKQFQMYGIDPSGKRAATMAVNALALALHPDETRNKVRVGVGEK